MRQNLANRLAGGGFWAIQTALMCVESVHEMREREIPNPAVNLSDTQILVTAAIQAFNLFLNVNMEDGGMVVQVQVGPDPKFADKYGAPITQEQWLELQRDRAYKQIAMWHNEYRVAVFTMWTGCDTNACTPPHIFATVVGRFTDEGMEFTHTFKTTCLADAREAHRQAVELVKAGRL